MLKNLFIIVGKCPPKFIWEFDFYHQINVMIIPVKTKLWDKDSFSLVESINNFKTTAVNLNPWNSRMTKLTTPFHLLP